MVQAVFDRTVATVQFEQSLEIGSGRIKPGDPVSDLDAGFPAGNFGDIPLDGEDLSGIGEGRIIIQFRAGPDTAYFQSPMPLFSRCVLRGKMTPPFSGLLWSSPLCGIQPAKQPESHS